MFDLGIWGPDGQRERLSRCDNRGTSHLYPTVPTSLWIESLDRAKHSLGPKCVL